LPKLIARRATTACAARTFGKVDVSKSYFPHFLISSFANLLILSFSHLLIF